VSKVGYSSLNLADHTGDDFTAIAKNWQLFSKTSGWSRGDIATCRQIHGEEIVQVNNGGHLDVEADALISLKPGLAVGVFTADCTPVLIACPSSRAVAAVHCGWRGARADLASKVVNRMHELTSSHPSSYHVYIGAGIAQCSYEVGAEVAEQFLSLPINGDRVDPSPKPGKYLLDVGGTVIDQLLVAGIRLANIDYDVRDTYSQPELFFSYRRDGASTGRMLAYVGWR